MGEEETSWTRYNKLELIDSLMVKMSKSIKLDPAQVIMTALFKARHLSPVEQVRRIEKEKWALVKISNVS